MERCFLLYGGELFNKGAQAMTFIAADELTRRFPGCRIILVSNADRKRGEQELSQYRFEVIGSPKSRLSRLAAYPMFHKALLRQKKDPALSHYVDVLQNCEAMLDISGYIFGSDWGAKRAMNYLRRIEFMEKLGIPVYLMPQSFGPLDFPGKEGKRVHSLARKVLPGVRLIMARETEGKRMLEQAYGLTNVEKTADLVLQNKGICRENIYVHPTEHAAPQIPDNSVGLIPNKKNEKFGDKATLDAAYHAMIDYLLAQDRNVVLLAHAPGDSEICAAIKAQYPDEQRVQWIDRELSCLEFDETVKKFDYVIASRFHAIVHAYRNAVPAVILGWATKYQELASSMEQSDFQLDVRKDLTADVAENMVRQMNAQWTEASKRLRRHVTEIQKENVFDKIVPRSEVQ